MGYYIRVLTRNERHVPVTKIKERFDSENLQVQIECEDCRTDFWNLVTINHINGTPICCVERNEVAENSLEKDEIVEFSEEIEAYYPKSAVKWLKKFLPTVKVVYAIQILSGSENENGWDIIGALKNELWGTLGGIIQADSEGFSNEEGYHILWQFNNDVSGQWCFAVKNIFGRWVNFKMDLGNLEQREVLMKGKVPKGVELL